jgi:glutamate-ammonia-ligase adenylyltransferase
VERAAWQGAVCSLRKREILRIGARDLCLGVSTERVMAEISDLADGIVRACLARLGERAGFCVIALGKLGGKELNYSSDIDLLALRSDTCQAAEAARLMDDLRADLSAHTPEGHAYRVDLRLRPYGTAGELVPSLGALAHYYGSAAGLWEVQALLKARPIAGDGELGARFLEEVRPLLRARRSREQVAASIGRMRRQALRWSERALPQTTDVKTGLGGIRDIEFLVQGLQLLHAADTPGVLAGGTLAGLEALGGAGILPQDRAGQLAEDYLFLRRVEHFLQIHEDRQTHSLPRDPAKLDALARQVLGAGAGARDFLAELATRFQRVRDASGQLFAAGA